MSDSQLLQAILDKIDRGNCPESKWPNGKGEYWGLCPFCARPEVGEFSFNATRFHCFGCGAEGGLRKLAEKLGVDVLTLFSEGQATNFFLKDYALAKHLDIEFLKAVGVSERKYYGRNTAVRMAYLDETGLEIAVRWRLALSGENRFRWNKGSKVRPYGLWRLQKARDKGYLWIVEGESDTQTLWSYGEPALGVPGAATWKKPWADMLPEGIEVYIWREPDEGGDKLVSDIAKTLADAYVVSPPADRKDISECHIKGDDVLAILATCKEQAVTISQIQAKAQSKEASKFYQAAADLLRCPSILDRWASLCEEMGLVGEQDNAKLIYLALTSRLLDKPVSIAVKGPSSGGKSFTVETVLRAFPDTAYLDFTSMSDHALVYDDRPIEHRFIVLYEASGLGREKPGEINNLAYMLRSLLSEGCIKYTTVEKGEEGLQPRVIERPGPTGLIVTTTWASLHAENETRMISLNIKDNVEQTKGVFLALAERANGNIQQNPDLSGWHALQEWLSLAGDKEVSIPFAKELAKLADPAAVRLRRDFGKVISLIQTHAILHQMQRERDAHGRVVAKIEDYVVIHGLISRVLDEGVQAAVSDTVRETVNTVGALIKGAKDSVSVTELAAALGIDKAAASRRQAVARELGYLINQEERRGRPARLVLGDALPEDRPILPEPEKIQSSKSVEIDEDRETIKGQEESATEEKNNVVLDPSETASTDQHFDEEDDLDTDSIPF